MDSALFQRLQLHSTYPSPTSLCRALTSPLGLSKNKESLQGREWVGTAHKGIRRATNVRVFCTVILCFFKSRDNITLPCADCFKNSEEVCLEFSYVENV